MPLQQEALAIQVVVRNRLLARLPASEQQLLSRLLRTVSVEEGLVLFEEDSTPEALWFPLDAVISLLTTTYGGEMVEATLTGNDGVAGVALALGGPNAHRAQIQARGEMLALSARLYREARHQLPALQAMVLRYANFLTASIGHWAACLAFHTLEQRFAGWLVAMSTLSGRNIVLLTQEFVAAVLGVYRPTINQATGTLVGRGVLAHRRGVFQILDAKALEALACPCQRDITNHYHLSFNARSVPA